jgi:hypothetical protein
MPLRFTIRDLLWLTVVAAVLVCWWLDRSRLKQQIESISPYNSGPNILFEDGHYRYPNSGR